MTERTREDITADMMALLRRESGEVGGPPYSHSDVTYLASQLHRLVTEMAALPAKPSVLTRLKGLTKD